MLPYCYSGRPHGHTVSCNQRQWSATTYQIQCLDTVEADLASEITCPHLSVRVTVRSGCNHPFCINGSRSRALVTACFLPLNWCHFCSLRRSLHQGYWAVTHDCSEQIPHVFAPSADVVLSRRAVLAASVSGPIRQRSHRQVRVRQINKSIHIYRLDMTVWKPIVSTNLILYFVRHAQGGSYRRNWRSVVLF